MFAGASSLQRSEEHTSELQSLRHLVCRLLLEKKKDDEHCRYPEALRRLNGAGLRRGLDRPILLSHGFFFNDTATTEIYTLSLHDALPICSVRMVTDSTGAVVMRLELDAWGN